MNWISRLERKYGRFCIPNLISIIVGGQILVYAIELFVNQFISVYLGLSRSLLLMGQVWRLITCLLYTSDVYKRQLEMKLVEAEYTLDRSKIMFYFTADGRVDFRELVKDLAGIFHTRIEGGFPPVTHQIEITQCP